MNLHNNSRLQIAFYGDDFTGSTDALEFLCRSGLKTMLFIAVPTKEQLAKYSNLEAIGVAGMSRAMSPLEMEEALPPIFKGLQKLNPRHLHYKVCSTFDSSPNIGSIGKAIDIAADIFKSRLIPLLVAAPILGRYCLFGNLFARMGIGSNGEIYRLDRHPSMSKHPTTPADEGDIRLHLAKQTEKKIALFNILDLHQYQERRAIPNFENAEIVLFDGLKQEDLKSIGEFIDAQTNPSQSLFSVGSSGVEMALGAHWQAQKLTVAPTWTPVNPEGPILVASGSCSVVSANQMTYALNNGFAGIAIDTVALAKQFVDTNMEANFKLIAQAALAYAEQASLLIKAGKNVLVHTSLGNDDARVQATDQLFKQNKFNPSTTAKFYGSLLGQIAKAVAQQTALQRIVLVGGDTSSYAARAMDIESVAMIAPLSSGAPLCRAYAPGSALDQRQVVFKGGQVGKEDILLTATQIL